MAASSEASTRRALGAALGLLLAIASSAADAGPLLSATLEHSFLVSAELDAVSLRFTTTSASGTYSGGRFSLDAGSAFVRHISILPGDLTPNGTAIIPPPVTRAVIDFGANGALAGSIADASLAPPSAGIGGRWRLDAKIGKAPSFTVFRLPLSVGVPITAHTPNTTLFPTPSLEVFGTGDVWHLGHISATGLTTRFLPRSDVHATGEVAITPSGGTQITLVSLSRVRVRGLVNLTGTNLARLTLLYAPEPRGALLLGVTSATLACVGLRRRRSGR
jgi:hypothetical protein